MFGKSHEPLKPMIRPDYGDNFLKDPAVRMLRGNFSWVGDFLKIKSLQAEIADLKESRRKTKELPKKTKELLAEAGQYFAEYKAQRTRLIQKAFGRVNLNDNPLFNLVQGGRIMLPGSGTVPFHGYIAWEELEAAIKSMSNDAAISEKDRAKALEHIDKRLPELKQQLLELNPKSSHFTRTGFTGDIRDQFVKRWATLQKKVDAPCSPSGQALKYSSVGEQEAFKKLKIGDFINEKMARFRPYDPNEER